MAKSFEEKVLDAIRNYADKFSSLKAAAKEIGIKYETFRSWYSGVKSPTIESLSPVADVLGLKLAFDSTEAAKDVCFVNVKILEIGENVEPPMAEDYIAAPLMGEVGAGPGYLPSDVIQGWFMVYNRLLPVSHGQNLIAVIIGDHSTSMQPTLNPRDIVLINRDDRDVSQDGHIMLVLDPLDGSGMIKRVSIQKNKDDIQITYYSDNAANWPPHVYSLNNDFDGDWNKAIVGRVIWSWSDMRKK